MCNYTRKDLFIPSQFLEILFAEFSTVHQLSIFSPPRLVVGILWIKKLKFNFKLFITSSNKLEGERCKIKCPVKSDGGAILTGKVN